MGNSRNQPMLDKPRTPVNRWTGIKRKLMNIDVRRIDIRHMTPFQRRLASGTLALLLLAAAFGFYLSRTSLYTVEVGGDVIGVAKSKAAVVAMIDQLSAEISQGWDREVWLDGNVTYRRVRDRGLTPDDPEALKSKLNRYLPLMTNAFVITVDGRPAVGLVDKDTAQGIIDEIKDTYRQGLTAKGADVVLVKIEQRVEVKQSACKVSDLRSAEDAKQILLRGTDRIVTATVQRGDSMWLIAQRANMPVDDLIKANPDVKPSQIQPGQKINLVKADPYVTLYSVERRTYTEAIPYAVQTKKDDSLWPWVRKVEQKGKSGQRQRVVEITRENGIEVSTKTIETKTLSTPVTEIAVVGTKQIPDRGTGTFVWPTMGVITSRFGYRGREYHTGLDIGAPLGTAVLAADSGTVVDAGWHGNLGRYVLIDHGGGHIKTTYAHMSSIAVAIGDTVEKGQLIGRVGNTGRSTGPHLHFEVRVDGKAVNPLNYYPND
ncbi:MAG: peptidoglycan DD-metalloendopeptidase family protein [Chloroflexota bacterium]